MKMGCVFLVAAFLVGCAPQKASIRSVPAEGQVQFFAQGAELLVSEGKHTAAVTPAARTVDVGSHLEFTVSVLNRGNEAFTFSTENVSATALAADDETVSIEVFTHEQLVEFERSRQRRIAFGAALQAFGDSMSAQQSSLQHHHGTFHGPQSSGVYSGTTISRGSASADQAQIQARAYERGAQIRVEADARIRTLSETLLLKQTVFPHSYHGGKVVMRSPKFENSDAILVELVLDVDEEKHEFRFRISRTE